MCATTQRSQPCVRPVIVVMTLTAIALYFALRLTGPGLFQDVCLVLFAACVTGVVLIASYAIHLTQSH